MYTLLLSIHSLFRWAVLISLLYALLRAYRGWLLGKSFSKLDNTTCHVTTTTAHIQLVLGVVLYCISPVVDYFLHHFSDAIHRREIRFFGMEHPFVMLLAIFVITIGSVKVRKCQEDKEKFKTMVLWFTAGLLLILSSIPWSFSPLVSRPLIRTM